MERLREVLDHHDESEVVIEQRDENSFELSSGHSSRMIKLEEAEAYLGSVQRVEIRYIDGSVRKNF